MLISENFALYLCLDQSFKNDEKRVMIHLEEEILQIIQWVFFSHFENSNPRYCRTFSHFQKYQHLFVIEYFIKVSKVFLLSLEGKKNAQKIILKLIWRKIFWSVWKIVWDSKFQRQIYRKKLKLIYFQISHLLVMFAFLC